MADDTRTDSAEGGFRPSWLARYSTVVAIVAFLVVLAGALTQAYAVFGYRMGWVPLRLSLTTLLPYGALIAGIGAALCLVVTIVFAARAKNNGFGRSALIAGVGIVIGAIAFYVPYSVRQSARGAPPIHDISTDTDNPPQFVEAVPLRKATGATNTTEYRLEGGRPGNRINIPEAQHKAFPDIKPIILRGVAPGDAFKRALEAVDKMGWQLIVAKPEEGRIEAWDKTFWFGFIDDVVIRITPIENGSKIDVRSLSRIGGGDAGTNARRIRAYVAALEK